MFRKSIVALTLTAAAATVSTSHDARADFMEGGMVCTQTSEGFPVCTGQIGEGGGGASVLAYSAWLPNGGWTEVYDDGDWWVDHNPDGSVTIGFDDAGSANPFAGANYIKGPSLPDVPGNYQKKQKPSTAGKPTWKGPKRNLAQLKASASVKTGAFSSLIPASANVSFVQGQAAAPSVDVTFAGSGQCKGFLMVSKDGKLVSSSAQSFSFPGKKPVALPKAPGKYKIELLGNSGCMGLRRSTEVSVNMVLRARPIALPRIAGR